MDGFESGDLGLWGGINGATTNNSRAGRTGNYCLTFSQSQSLSTGLSTSAEVYVAFKHSMPMTSSNCRLVFYSGGTQLGGITIAWNNVTAWRGSETALTSGIYSLPSDLFYLLEIWYKPKIDGTGRFKILYNGLTTIDFTGQTANNALSVTGIGFWAGAPSSSSYVDDFIVDDANWIGSTSIQSLVPTGAGATTQFDPSTGANYECVNEIPPSDTDYVSTNVPDEIDTYACGNLPGTINSVKAVQVQARCMQEGSPAVPKIQLVTRPTSTDRVSASKSVQTFAPGMVSNIWELNPDDSAAWAEADVNGMEIGVKAVAS